MYRALFAAILLALLKSAEAIEGDLPHGGNEACEECDGDGGSLLQFAARERRSQQVPADAHLQVAWLHVPRCGVGFGATLARLSGDASVPVQANRSTWAPSHHSAHLLVKIAGGANDSWGEPRARLFEHYRGRLFGMFRSPVNRIYSAWNNISRPLHMDAGMFFDEQVGMTTKMLAGQKTDALLGESITPDVALAINRVRSFKFIGLTDHAMFGGETLTTDLQNMRPGLYANEDPEVKDFFMHRHDPYDTEVFAEASKLFWANVAKYKFSLSDCLRASDDGLQRGKIPDDCASKHERRLVTDPRWFWNARKSKPAYILQPLIDQPPVVQNRRSKLAVLMVSDLGEISQPALWIAWLASANGAGLGTSMYIHTQHAENVTQGLRMYVVNNTIATAWCDCRNAALKLMEHAMSDPDITHMVLVSDNSIPVKSVRFILAKLDADPSTRMCQDRSWDVPRAETWWVISRSDAALFIGHRDLLSNAIEHGMCTDSFEKPCLDENSWFLPLMLRNARWGIQSPLRDECTMLTDWSGTCKSWARHAATCNCPNLLRSREPATTARPATYTEVSQAGFAELLRSPFWFARKFTRESFVFDFDPVAVAKAKWVEDIRANGPSLGTPGTRCSAATLATLHRRGPGLIISGQGGSATRVAQEIVAVLGTHDFGNIDSKTKDSWSVRRAHLLTDGLFTVGMNEAGSVAYDIEETLPLSDRDRLFRRACASLMKHRASKPNVTLPWALKEPWLRFLLPFYDRLLGVEGYKFLHVVHDLRDIHDFHGDERFARRLSSRNLKLALRSAAATLSGRWGHKWNIKKRVKAAYVWGLVELELHEWWSRERPAGYFLLTELDMASFRHSARRSRALAAFLGEATPTPATLWAAARLYRKKRDVHDDRYQLMDAIIKLPGMEITRRAMKTFGFME